MIRHYCGVDTVLTLDKWLKFIKLILVKCIEICFLCLNLFFLWWYFISQIFDFYFLFFRRLEILIESDYFSWFLHSVIWFEYLTVCLRLCVFFNQSLNFLLKNNKELINLINNFIWVQTIILILFFHF